MAISKAVLVTGCSSGIGRATTELFADRGWTVYATARRPDSIADLEERGARVLALDVDDEASMAVAVEQVEREESAVGVLINNAGYGLQGAIETTPMEDVRKQFETNFFGLVRLTQLVLPKMRAQGWGRIVNISSMGGRIELPGGGFYHATKHALEAYSDVLRFELRQFGVDVVIVEPGLIKTRFGDTATDTIELDDAPPYGRFNSVVHAKVHGAYNGPMGRLAAGPDRVARTILKAVESRRPRTRYPITAGARILVGLQAILPDRGWDALMRSQYPSPGKKD